MKEIRVKCYTQGSSVASTRFRISQLTERLANHGIRFIFSHAYKSSYPPRQRIKRLYWFFLECFSRFCSVFIQSSEEINIFQREMISTMYTFERFVRGKTILDVDDAVWLHKKGQAIDKIAQNADHIVCGNAYIANYFRKFKVPSTVIPTVVDTDRFFASGIREPIIGWSGGSGAFGYLYEIEDQIANVLKRHSTWKLRVIADLKPNFTLIPEDRYEFIEWSPSCEVEAISTMSIGLMPLRDDAWSLGKCSYKMLLYMACELPVIVSNVGMNKEILDQSEVGIGIKRGDEWGKAIEALILDPNLRVRMGLDARLLVKEKYSLNVAEIKWQSVINCVNNL